MSRYAIFAEPKWDNIVFESLTHASIVAYILKLRLNICAAASSWQLMT